MRFSLSFSAALLGLAALVRASNVVDLDSTNFDALIGKDKPALVEFFAPWCGHCKNLAPTYEQLADAFDSNKVIIAKTDADGVGRELGSRFGVQGFPTLKWFPAGSLEPEEYNSGRDLDSLVGFITEKSGVKSNIKPPPPPAALELDASNFDEIVDGSKNVLVAFTAPWCGHCKNMKPAYEQAARAFENEDDVIVAQVNADEADNKDLAGRYEVRSFPTIQFFPKGSKEPVRYAEGRSTEQFVEFLNEKAGTHRTADGQLNDSAGQEAQLSKVAFGFFKNPEEREALLAKAKAHLEELPAKLEEAGKYYVRAMERVIAKGDDWVTKESARLTNLLASPSLASFKKDQLKIKTNILSAFVTEKGDVVVEELEEEDAVPRDEL